jgi:hypothetical protein
MLLSWSLSESFKKNGTSYINKNENNMILE